MEPAPTDVVSLRFRPTATELEGALTAYGGRLRRVVVVPLVVALLSGLAAVRFHQPLLWTVVGGGVAYAAGMLPVVLRARRILDAWLARTTASDSRVELDGDGLTWWGPNGSWMRVPWRLVLGVRESPDGLTFVMRGAAVFVLPSTSFAHVREAVMRIVSRLPPAPPAAEATGARSSQVSGPRVVLAWLALLLAAMCAWWLLVRGR